MVNQQETLEARDIGLAFIFHVIKLNEGINSQEFEKMMLDEIFPAVNTQESSLSGDDANPDIHRLMTGNQFDKEYTWVVQMEYFIHHTPLPNWLSQRASKSYDDVASKLDAFGEKTETNILYDVKEWRQRLGLDSD